MSEWVFDVEVENTPLATTGGHTWAAAYRLADYLFAAATEVGLNNPGVRILELGAGCGWLGTTLARNLPHAAAVCLTEQEEGGACDWLQHNVGANRRCGLPLTKVQVKPCDWLQYASEDIAATSPGPTALDLAGTEWNFILGSDLIYNKVGATCLPRVMAALARPSTKIFYCHTKHRYDLLDMEFFEELEAAGLSFEEVWEPGAVAPPASPPLSFPPTDLFPEQRIAVFLIRKM